MAFVIFLAVLARTWASPHPLADALQRGRPEYARKGPQLMQSQVSGSGY